MDGRWAQTAKWCWCDAGPKMFGDSFWNCTKAGERIQPRVLLNIGPSFAQKIWPDIALRLIYDCDSEPHKSIHKRIWAKLTGCLGRQVLREFIHFTLKTGLWIPT